MSVHDESMTLSLSGRVFGLSSVPFIADSTYKVATNTA